MYFSTCKTAEELKKAYKEAAKKLHPDNGGDAELFKQMQQEFSGAWDRLKNVHVNASGETYTKETEETASAFMELIEKLLNLSGCHVELCGSWIWVSGDTRQHKDVLRALRFRWSSNKAAWYFHPEPYRRRHGKEYSLDEIREMYGSTEY